jgi:sulfide:quinone oxidoreductase
MAAKLDLDRWHIVLVDKDENHYYQPGFLFIPFGVYREGDVVKPKRALLPGTIEVIFSDIERIEPAQNRVYLMKDDQVIHYDYLVVATGCEIRPDQIDGLLDGGWRETIFDFYTPDGALALHDALSRWGGGRLVVNIAEMPIKCPVAPLEFIFLADAYFRQRGMRSQVELVFSTPLDNAFTKPRAASVLGDLLAQKDIYLEADFNIMEVDPSKQVIRSYDEREIGYDLLVSVPTNMGAEMVERSGMGDDLNYIPTDAHTLQSKQWENIFVIGDAGDVPTSKAGSATHFMLDVVVENVFNHMTGRELEPGFDGHANCFIETGDSKGVLIDFNYEVEPLPGVYPLPVIGPMQLLKESRINHLGKLSFKWVYWNLLLPGRPIPVSNQFSMVGKHN